MKIIIQISIFYQLKIYNTSQHDIKIKIYQLKNYYKHKIKALI